MYHRPDREGLLKKPSFGRSKQHPYKRTRMNTAS